MQYVRGHPFSCSYEFLLHQLDMNSACSCSLGQATRRLGVWHSNFGSTAVALVAYFLTLGSGDKPIDVQQTCSDLMDGPLSFLYQDLDVSDPEKAYQSHFVLHLLAHAHLRPCGGCPDIPALDTAALREHGAKGAIALCCSAVCNTFSSWWIRLC